MSGACAASQRAYVGRVTSEDSFGDATIPTGAYETPVIDASVHIFCKSNKDLRSFLREPFKSRGFPDYEMDWYGAPGGEYASKAQGPDRQYPGSDPEFVGSAAVRRARRRRRDPAPDDAGHHARPPSRHRDRRSAQRVDGVALARATTHTPTGSAEPSGSIPTTSPVPCAKSPSTPTTRGWCRSGSHCSRASCTASRSTGRCGKPPRREPSGRGAHRGRRGRLVRTDAVGCPADL